VTSAARFRRLELALAALGITAVLAIALTALDAVRFHVGAAARALGGAPVEDVGLGDVVVLALAAVEAAMLAAAGVAVLRRVRGQRAFLRRLPVLGEREIGGRRVVLVGGGRPLAFTAGFLRARIWMSVATLELLGARELRAVLAHEAQHAARRDPLRLLAAEALAAAFFLVPPLRSLGRRQAALAELVADAAAVRELGDPRALASALLAFDGSGPPSPPSGSTTCSARATTRTCPPRCSRCAASRWRRWGCAPRSSCWARITSSWRRWRRRCARSARSRRSRCWRCRPGSRAAGSRARCGRWRERASRSEARLILLTPPHHDASLVLGVGIGCRANGPPCPR
jgi:Zn-dependent protease with chaperone function